MARRARYLEGFGNRKPGPWARVDPRHPLARGLTSCWLFNENGTRVRDLASFNYFDSDVADRWYAGSFGNTCFGFNNGGFNTASTAGLQNASITVLAWVRPSTSQISRCFIDCFRGGGNNNGWALGISDSSSDIAKWYTCQTGVSSNTLVSTTALATYGLYQVVGTFDDASGAKGLYVNGALEASTTWAHSIDYTGTGGAMAGLNGDGQGWIGYSEAVMVWSRALTQGEIRQLYARPFAFLNPAPASTRTFVVASVDVSPSAPAGGATLTAPAPSDSTGDTLTAPAAGGTWDAPLGASVAGLAAAPPAASAAWAAPAPGLGLSRSAQADFLVGSAYWDAPAPAASAGWSATARFALSVLDAPAPALAGGATAVAPAAAAALNAPPPTAGTSTGTLADFLVGAAYWDAPAPLASADANASAPAAGLTATAPAPDATADALADAAPAPAFVLDAPPPVAGTSTGTLADFLVGAAYWDAPAPEPPAAAAPDPPGPGGGGLMLLGVGR
jgi:Concanavalin A-like lectin/glucanases superfamily